MHDLIGIYSIIIGVYFGLSIIFAAVGALYGFRKPGRRFSRRQAAGILALSGLFLPGVSIISGLLAFLWRNEL